MDDHIGVRVVLATRREQVVIELQVAPGTTADEALRLAQQRAGWPDAVPGGLRLGIFGRLVSGDHVLQAGDRVEVLRPLTHDPRAERRRRAARAAHRRSARRR